jgi:hypothetical protein
VAVLEPAATDQGPSSDGDEDRSAARCFGAVDRIRRRWTTRCSLALGDGQRAARALRRYQPGEFLDRSQALRLSQNAMLGLDREHRPEIVLRGARLLGCLAAARHAGLPWVREYREALLSG